MKKWITALVFAFLFLVATIGNTYANTSVNVYLVPTYPSQISDERWYDKGELVIYEAWGNTSTTRFQVLLKVGPYHYQQITDSHDVTAGQHEVYSFTVPSSGYYVLELECTTGTNCEASGSMDDYGN